MKRVWIGIIVLFGCFFSSLSLFGEESKMKIVVFNLDKMPDDSSMEDVRTFSDYVRDAFIKTGKFDVVSTNDINNKPDVKRALTGSVSKIGDNYMISLKLINLETAKYITSVSVQATNKDDVLKEIDSKVALLTKKSFENIADEKGTPVPLSRLNSGDKKNQTSEQSSLIPVLNITGYSLIGASAICAGLGIFFDISAQNNYNSAKAAYRDYQDAASDAKWQTYQGYVTNTAQNLSARNISYIAGGISLGVGLACVITTFFLPKDNVSVTIAPDKLTICYKF
jgi:hypothetical protein